MELIPGLPDDIARECLTRVSYKDFPQIAATCRDWRAEIHLPQFSRRRRAVGFSQPLIVFAQARVQPGKDSEPVSGATKYLAAPTYRLTAFEPDSGEWTELTPGFGASGSDRLPMFSQIVRVGSELLVIGGWDPATWTVSNAVFVYDFVRATWRRGKDMPGAARSFFACAAADSDRRVYVAGGHDEQKNALRSAMAYDVARDEWSVMPEMSRERDECKGIFRRGRFVAVGGYATAMQGRFDGGAEAFDPSAWRWDPVDEGFLEDGACPRTCCAAAAEAEEYMCRAGWVAARKGGAWKAVAELPREVKEVACVVTWRERLMVIGSPSFGEPHQAYVLDTCRYAWTKVTVPEEFSGHVQSGCCLEQ